MRRRHPEAPWRRNDCPADSRNPPTLAGANYTVQSPSRIAFGWKKILALEDVGSRTGRAPPSRTGARFPGTSSWSSSPREGGTAVQASQTAVASSRALQTPFTSVWMLCALLGEYPLPAGCATYFGWAGSAGEGVSWCQSGTLSPAPTPGSKRALKSKKMEKICDPEHFLRTG